MGNKEIEYSKFIHYVIVEGLDDFSKRAHNILLAKVRKIIKDNGGIVDSVSMPEIDPVSITKTVKYRLPKGVNIDLPKK